MILPSPSSNALASLSTPSLRRCNASTSLDDNGRYGYVTGVPGATVTLRRGDLGGGDRRDSHSET